MREPLTQEAERRPDQPELADRALVDELLQPLRLRMVAVHERLHQDPPRSAGGVEGALDLLRPPVERLLAEHMLSGLERAHRPLDVQRVRQRDVDRVDVRILEERLIRAVRGRDLPLARICVGGLLRPARDGDEVDHRRLLRARDHLAVDIRRREDAESHASSSGRSAG